MQGKKNEVSENVSVRFLIPSELKRDFDILLSLRNENISDYLRGAISQLVEQNRELLNAIEKLRQQHRG